MSTILIAILAFISSISQLIFLVINDAAISDKRPLETIKTK